MRFIVLLLAIFVIDIFLMLGCTSALKNANPKPMTAVRSGVQEQKNHPQGSKRLEQDKPHFPLGNLQLPAEAKIDIAVPGIYYEKPNLVVDAKTWVAVSCKGSYCDLTPVKLEMVKKDDPAGSTLTSYEIKGSAVGIFYLQGIKLDAPTSIIHAPFPSSGETSFPVGDAMGAPDGRLWIS